jgi:hypothetical protein
MVMAVFVTFCSCKDEHKTPAEQLWHVYLSSEKDEPVAFVLPYYTEEENAVVALGGLVCEGDPANRHGRIEATLSVDRSLVSAYNTAHASDYLPLPDNAFLIHPQTLNIEDELSLSITSYLTVIRAQLDIDKAYLLPVTVSLSASDNVLLKEDKKIAWWLIYFGDAPVASGEVSLSPANGETTVVFPYAATANTVMSIGRMTYSGEAHDNHGHLEATLAADPALVAAYNTAHATAYLALPDNACSIIPQTLAIEEGETASATAQLTLIPTGLDKSQRYLLPVTIASFSSTAAGVTLDETGKTAWWIVYFEEPPIATGRVSLSSASDVATTILLPYAGTTDVAMPIGGLAYDGDAYDNHGHLEATIAADLSLVAAYNAAHATNYHPLPDNAFTILPQTLAIEEGQTASAGEFELTVIAANVVAGTRYLLPVTVSAFSSEAAGVSLNVEKKTLWRIVRFEDEPGTNLMEKNTWQLISWSSFWDNGGWYVPDFVIDDNLGTFWHTNANNVPENYPPHRLVIDMQKRRIISGIKIWTRQDGATHSMPKHITFELSDDQVAWTTLIDVPELPEIILPATGNPNADLTVAPPQTGRYLRVTIVDMWDGWTGVFYSNIAEITPY